MEPTFSRLVATGYVARDGDHMSLTAAGVHQVEYVYSLLLNRIADKLARSPGFARRPDRREVETALRHIAYRVLAQRDWVHDWDGDAPTVATPAVISTPTGAIPHPH
ncbi:hypothetical protein A4G29_00185 [Mycobacterium kansasii]|nr:hypothetical protein A4G29_00185 [Mycobacterium kansasii]